MHETHVNKEEEELNLKHHIWSELLTTLAVLVLPNGNGGAAMAAIFWRTRGVRGQEMGP